MISIGRKIIVNMMSRMGVEAVSKLLWFWFMVILVRKLGARDFGYFSYANSLCSLLVVLTDAGTNIWLVREASKNPAGISEYLSEIIGLKSLLSLGVFGIFSGWLIFGLPETSRLIFFLGFALLLSAYLDPLNAIYRAKKEMHLEAGMMFCWRFLIVIIGLLGLQFFRQGLLYLPWAFFLAAIIVFALSFYVVRTRFNFQWRGFNLEQSCKILKASMPLGLLLLFGAFFYKFNVIVLQWYQSAQNVGYYSAAFRLIEGLMFIPTFYTVSVFPFLCEAKSAEQLRKVFRLAVSGLLFLSILFGGMIYFFAGRIVLFLYGADFIPAIKVLQIFSIVIIFIFMNELFIYRMIAGKEEKTIIVNMAISGLLYGLLCFLLIPHFATVGAAICLLLALGILFVLNIISVWSDLSPLVSNETIDSI